MTSDKIRDMKSKSSQDNEARTPSIAGEICTLGFLSALVKRLNLGHTWITRSMKDA